MAQDCETCGGKNLSSLQYEYFCKAIKGSLPSSGGGGTSKTINLVEENSNGSTDAGVKSVSLLFRGSGGSLDGVSVPDGFSTDYSDLSGVNAIPFTVPTSGEGRIIISYVR